MCSIFGGRAAELIFFNKLTTSSKDDLDKATRIIYNHVINFGMSNEIKNLSYKIN